MQIRLASNNGFRANKPECFVLSEGGGIGCDNSNKQSSRSQR